MHTTILIKPTPWDTMAFNMPTWELLEYSATALQQANQTPGHYTLKVDPLTDKYLLHKYGFYYCDTLLEPYCTSIQLCKPDHPNTKISRQVQWTELLSICHESFAHGRFHRDFNLDKAHADLRYNNWLKQLYEKNTVYGLFWNEELAGFIAHNNNNLALHALAKPYRGQGLAKYWWGAVCHDLLMTGHAEVRSSISATNLAALNLYTSLGFRFRNPLDVYHLLVNDSKNKE